MVELRDATSIDRLRHFWHPVAWSVELTAAPLGTVLLNQPLVIWRSAGRLVAAIDRCPHRGTQLSLGALEAGNLTCPYHGWQFGSAGECAIMPQLAAGVPIIGRAQLSMVRVAERYGIIWVALDEPQVDIPAFPEWNDPTYRHVACPSYTWRAGAGCMVENFTDFGHLGFLHDGLLGTRDDLVVPPHHVDTEGLELHYEIAMQVPNTNDQFAVTDVREAIGGQTNSYVLSLPFTIHLHCRYHDSGAYRNLFFVAQPRSAGESTGYCYQSRNFDLDGDDDDEAFAEFQTVLALQDQPIVESQWPTEIPLNQTAELHMPFDRVALAYRRALRLLVSAPLPRERPGNLTKRSEQEPSVQQVSASNDVGRVTRAG